MYKIDSGNLLYDTRRSTQYSVMTERGGVGWEVGGRRQGKLVYPWLIHVDVWQKPTQDCKAIILPLKKKKKKKHRELSSVLCDDLEEGGESWEGGSKGRGLGYTYG